MEDLIAVQGAILTSNATLLGAVTEFREGIDQRLDRQFGEVTLDFRIVKDQLAKVDGRIGAIEQARTTEAALLVQAKEFVTARHSDDVHTADVDRNNAQLHSLSRNQRLAIMVAAIAGIGGLILNIINSVAGK